MVGFGLGFGAHSTSRQYAVLGQNVPISALVPSAQWSGLAGSGFVGGAPLDPVRTTAKPTCRLLVPPNQFFTEELVIGVWASANNNGSMLDNLGLEHVIVHYEGTSQFIEAPSFFAFDNANGNLVRYFGWWAVLQHSGVHGHADIYFEAVPKNKLMQSRIIGPYQFSPQATLYDANIEVNSTLSVVAGSRYQTISAAYEYLRTQAKQNPLVTITGGGPYTLSVPTVTSTVNNGYVNTIATVPITIKNLSAYAGDVSNVTSFRPRVTALHFIGENITFDFVDSTNFYSEVGQRLWLDGINVTNSAGRARLYRGQQPAISTLWRENPWITECNFSELHYAATGCNLVRGGTFTHMTSDLFDGSFCVIGTTTDNLDPVDFTTDIPALTVLYSGAASTATMALSGGAGASNRVVTLKENGSSIGTFAIANDNAGYLANTNYTVQNLADWINSKSGWTATVLDDTRAVCWLGKPNTAAVSFADTNTKSTLSLVTNIALHSDWYQTNEFGSAENVVIVDNKVFNSHCQCIFFSIAGAYTLKDFMVVNNAFGLDDGVLQSQWGKAGSLQHIVMAHNSYSGQGLLLRTDFGLNVDGYCLVANNVLRELIWNGGTPDADLVIADNHLFTGATAPTYATGTTIGGDGSSVFADATVGDFTPQGQLLSILKTPVVRHDLAGTSREVPAPLGAQAGPGAIAPAITSANPSGTYPENQPINGNLAANKPVTWSVSGTNAAAITIDPQSGAWSLEATDFEVRQSYTFTFVATDSSNDTAEQNIALAITDIDEVAPTLSSPNAIANGSSGATLSVTTNEGNGNLYWYVSTSATPPAAAVLIAGVGAVAGGSQIVSNSGTYTAAVSGLSASTTYYPHYLHRDQAGNQSAVSSGGSFTTGALAGANIAIVSSAVVLRTTDFAASYYASAFPFAGGAGSTLIAVVSMAQQATQAIGDLTVSVDGITMARISGAAHSAGSSRPICGVFVATGLTAGNKTIAVQIAGNARSCSVLAMEVVGLKTMDLLANTLAIEGNSLTYGHSYTPAAAGNLVLSALVTRQGDRGPFTPDAGVIELQDDSTGSTSTNDHSTFVGYRIANSTSAVNCGGSTTQNADILFVVTELRKA